MPRRIVVELTAEQQAELEDAVVRHPKPYVRERSAAILKVANGKSVKEVAEEGLLVPRTIDSLYFWIKRYEAEGLAGLLNKEGRGRKPAFSPSESERPVRGRPRQRTTAGTSGDSGARDSGAREAVGAAHGCGECA